MLKLPKDFHSCNQEKLFPRLLASLASLSRGKLLISLRQLLFFFRKSIPPIRKAGEKTMTILQGKKCLMNLVSLTFTTPSPLYFSLLPSCQTSFFEKICNTPIINRQTPTLFFVNPILQTILFTVLSYSANLKGKENS